MVKVARAAETVCADSINTPLLGKKNFQPLPLPARRGLQLGEGWHFRLE